MTSLNYKLSVHSRELPDIFDTESNCKLKFYKPNPEVFDFNVNICNTKDFKKFIERLKPDENLTNFTCKVKFSDAHLKQYSFVMISKIQQDGKYSRVIAEIVEKLKTVNEHFNIFIKEVSQNLFRHLVKSNKSFQNFLEFITMLNRYCNCIGFNDLVSFAFFCVVEKEDCFENNSEVMEEFVLRNLEIIRNYLLDHQAGDILYYMSKASTIKDDFYASIYEEFNPHYNKLKPDGVQVGNPSFKEALNFAVEENGKKLSGRFYSGVQILDVADCVRIFFINAAHDKPRFDSCINLLEFIKQEKSKEVFEKFMKGLLSLLKSSFFDNFIKKQRAIASRSLIGTVSFFTKLYYEDIITSEDLKPIIIAVVDRYSSEVEENPATADLFTDMYSPQLKEKLQNEVHLKRFIDRCLESKKETIKRKSKLQNDNGTSNRGDPKKAM